MEKKKWLHLAAVVMMLVLLGQVLELRARGQTSAAMSLSSVSVGSY